MGNKLDKYRKQLLKIELLYDIPISKAHRHSLPFAKIKSRLCTAIILGFQGRQKLIVKMLIVLSKSSRAFIITQEGLPGFLIKHHVSEADFFVEF